MHRSEQQIFNLAKAKARDENYSNLIMPTERVKKEVEEVLDLEEVKNWERPTISR